MCTVLSFSVVWVEKDHIYNEANIWNIQCYISLLKALLILKCNLVLCDQQQTLQMQVGTYAVLFSFRSHCIPSTHSAYVNDVCDNMTSFPAY
jgi:hypothetical protein